MDLSPATIRSALEPFGVEVNDRVAQQIASYIETLLFWNQRVNLTSITDAQEILGRHFGESMFGAQFIDRSAAKLVDVGSGAGFPGLALKLACPGLQIKLIEPAIKKAVFLSEVVRALELSGVEVIRARTEDVASVEADFVTARAVGNTGELLEWARREIVGNGQVMLWLGSADAERTRATPGWSWIEAAKIPGSRNRVILRGRKKIE